MKFLRMGVIFVLMVLVGCSSLFNEEEKKEQQSKLKAKEKQEYLEKVEKYSFNGEIIYVSLKLKSGKIVMKGSSGGNAVAGAVVGWYFLGPIGAIAGVGAGAGSFIETKNIPSKIEEMVVAAKSNNDSLVYYFNIIQNNEHSPTKFTLANALNPGEKIIIPSSKPFSRKPTIWSSYVFLLREKIEIWFNREKIELN